MIESVKEPEIRFQRAVNQTARVVSAYSTATTQQTPTGECEIVLRRLNPWRLGLLGPLSRFKFFNQHTKIPHDTDIYECKLNTYFLILYFFNIYI